MRAKEYIEINKNDMDFTEQISAILFHCADLRTDLSKTIQFYDCYLSTFEKLQRFLSNSCVHKIKKEFFWKLIHEELQSSVKADDSYSYLYQCLLQNKDLLENSAPTNDIVNCIHKQFEDYPKINIDDFMCDETNREYYENISGIFSTSDDILNIFNTAYELFDNVRCKMHKPIQASFYFKEYSYRTERHKYFILPLLAEYLNNYDYDLTENQRRNKQKVSDELSKYIVRTINPKSEIVKAKSYWQFFMNTLQITVSDKEKLALLISEQTKFNQLPENERQTYGIDFGRNCQLEIDKIRQLKALNTNSDEENKSNENRTLKVTTDVLISILQKAGISAMSDDKAKMARLISYLTNFSEAKIRQRLSNTDELVSYHATEVENVNTLLKDLNCDISIKYNKKR